MFNIATAYFKGINHLFSKTENIRFALVEVKISFISQSEKQKV